MAKKKTVLIVDDSDIDRTILRTILSEDFEIIEKTSGFAAINLLGGHPEGLDAMLLDISMPAVDGFDVLDFMKESNISNIPVFLITSEATKENVERATRYGVMEFIRKPFDKEYVTKRIRQQVGVVTEQALTDENVKETYRFIESLQNIYNRYLRNFGGDVGHCQRVSDLMRIMLTEYCAFYTEPALDKERIDIISRAGYFFDIGNMVVPPESLSIPDGAYHDIYANHTFMGMELVSLNQSDHCRYFVEVCSDICLHHHERYDGKGYPHRLIREHNLIYSQICRLACEFDCLFSRYQTHSQGLFLFASSELAKNEGNVSKAVFSAFTDSSEEILRYYQALD